jgi:Zn-dependent protease with chaperone function
VILILLAVGALMLSLPGRDRTPPRDLPAGTWARLATLSMVSGALAVETGLLLIALPTVTHALGWSQFLDSCHAVLAPVESDPSFVGWLAFALATVLGSRAAIAGFRSYRRAVGSRAEPWLGTHTRYHDFDLVVLPSDDPIAFGTPGRPPQVVISEALVRRLEPAALQAIIRHESAHHRHHHVRHLILLAAIEHALACVPAVRRSADVVRDGLEEWADADAARELSVRPALCQALADANAVPLGTAWRRIERVMRPASVSGRAARAWSYTPQSALALGSLAIVIIWLADPHVAAALGSHCA